MLQNLFIDNLPKKRIIFNNFEQEISLEQFLTDVDSLTKKLLATPNQRWALCYQNPYSFAVALCAVLESKNNPVLLPNSQHGTIKLLKKEFDSILSDIPNLLLNSKHQKNLGQQRINAKDEGYITFFTSGSTATPKKIIRSLTQITKEIETLESAFGSLIKNSAIFATVSHQHIYGLLFYILWPLYTKRIIHIPTLIYPESIESTLNQNGATTLITSPSLLTRMPNIKITNKAITIFSSGGKLKSTPVTGGNIIDILGSTETGGVAFRNISDYNWTPLPKVKVAIKNHCLKVSSPFCSNGCFVMGDKAQINPDGSFQLLERADRIVKIEGKRTSLTEIENILKQQQFIQEAIAISMEAKRQYIAVVIVLNSKGKEYLKTNSKKALNTELKKQLAQYFDTIILPKKIRYLDKIPENNQGKHVLMEIKNLFNN